MTSLKLGHLPLGVDLVELKKAKEFYREHKVRLGSFFSKAEAASILQSKKPAQKLALLLAAKEAVFKSLDLPWMGPGGFKEIQIIFESPRSISCRVSKRMLCASGKPAMNLFYLKTKDYVIVRCEPSLN